MKLSAQHSFSIVSAERDIADCKRTIRQVEKQRDQLDAAERKARARLRVAEAARVDALRRALGRQDVGTVTVTGIDEYLQADDPATVELEVIE